MMAMAWTFDEFRDRFRVHIEYEVDLLSTPVKPTWGSFGPDSVLHLFEFDPTAGMTAHTPSDPTFRGVILTGPDLPGEGVVRDFRVLRDGYYIEFVDGSVRYVLDPAPWLAIRDEVRECINPRLWQVLVDADVT
jgi:hypothetical protein